MSDYISRQAAIDEFEKELSAKYKRRELAIGFVGVKSILDNLPSADVVEVVYCSECRYWNELLGVCQRRQKLYGYGVKDYCSKAERRTDGEFSTRN